MKLRDIGDSIMVNRVRRREKLPPDLEAKASAVYAVLGRHLNQTIEKWLDGFCFDMNPDKEIAIWETYAQIYAKWTKGKQPYYQAVCYRAILEDIAETPVVFQGQAPPPTTVKCPFTGSAKTLFEQVMRDLKAKNN